MDPGPSMVVPTPHPIFLDMHSDLLSVSLGQDNDREWRGSQPTLAARLAHHV
jgi:hypothetical protein